VGPCTYGNDEIICPAVLQTLGSSLVQVSRGGRLTQKGNASSVGGVRVSSLPTLESINALNNINGIGPGPYFTENFLQPLGKIDTFSNSSKAQEQFTQSATGPLFRSGWENNPFDSNLL